jgi:hypothetical protein
MVKEFANETAKHWFKHAIKKEPRESPFYKSVWATLARNFRSS